MPCVGSSPSRGSHVYVGVDVSSGDLVAISDWLLPSATKHGTEPECRPEHAADHQTQVLSLTLATCFRQHSVYNLYCLKVHLSAKNTRWGVLDVCLCSYSCLLWQWWRWRRRWWLSEFWAFFWLVLLTSLNQSASVSVTLILILTLILTLSLNQSASVSVASILTLTLSLKAYVSV